jgi:hypothetical protein
MLSGQGYWTPDGAVVGEYVAVAVWWLEGGNVKDSEIDLIMCRFVHHESHMKSSKAKSVA